MRTQNNFSIPMYRFLFVLFIAILLSSCNSPEDKAKSLIKQNLKESLHDWDSYESVKFGTMDSSFFSIYDNPNYIGAINRYHSLKKEYKDSEAEFWIYKGESDWAKNGRQNSIDNNFRLLDSMKLYSQIMIGIEEKFKPDFNGWKMQHSYRSNNALGNKIISHYIYYFNKDITEIVKQEDISDSVHK